MTKNSSVISTNFKPKMVVLVAVRGLNFSFINVQFVRLLHFSRLSWNH